MTNLKLVAPCWLQVWVSLLGGGWLWPAALCAERAVTLPVGFNLPRWLLRAWAFVGSLGSVSLYSCGLPLIFPLSCSPCFFILFYGKLASEVNQHKKVLWWTFQLYMRTMFEGSWPSNKHKLFHHIRYVPAFLPPSLCIVPFLVGTSVLLRILVKKTKPAGLLLSVCWFLWWLENNSILVKDKNTLLLLIDMNRWCDPPLRAFEEQFMDNDKGNIYLIHVWKMSTCL